MARNSKEPDRAEAERMRRRKETRFCPFPTDMGSHQVASSRRITWCDRITLVAERRTGCRVTGKWCGGCQVFYADAHALVKRQKVMLRGRDGTVAGGVSLNREQGGGSRSQVEKLGTLRVPHSS